MSSQSLRVVEGGRGPRGWETFWARDSWRQSEVPNGELSSTHGGDRRINFGRLQQPWLKEAAKRWARGSRQVHGTELLHKPLRNPVHQLVGGTTCAGYTPGGLNWEKSLIHVP